MPEANKVKKVCKLGHNYDGYFSPLPVVLVISLPISSLTVNTNIRTHYLTYPLSNPHMVLCTISALDGPTIHHRG
jgi:hypothetical protein